MTTKAKPLHFFIGIKFNTGFYDTEINKYLQKPINYNTGLVNSVLTLTNTSPIQTSWTVPATAITNYVNYDNTAKTIISNVSGTPSTVIDLNLSGSIGSSTAQKFVLPSNTSTSTVGQVLSILNASTKTTQWITIPTQISNYTNYDNTLKTLISNVSGSPTTIVDLVISSSIGSITAQKFVLPSNTSTSTVGQVLSILDATAKTTQWITIPTQIPNYINYDNTTKILNIMNSNNNVTGSIVDLVLSETIGISIDHKFKLPSNTATASAYDVLALTNMTTKSTNWTTVPIITNYTNYDNTLKTLISNVSGAPTTIVDLVISSSIGSATAQKFVLPSNSSTSTVGQVLSILDATAKTTQWITIPTQISTYVQYNFLTSVFINKISGLPDTNITTIVIDDIGKSGQTFTLPTNTSSTTVGQVLSILNATSKTTQWITIPTQIANYVNYTSPNLISNVSGTPTTITDLTITNIKSNSYDSSVVDTGIITIGGGVLRSGNINIGTAKNTTSAQTIRIGSGDINATGQDIIFSRPIKLPSIVQLSNLDLGYTLPNITATTTAYASGTVSLSIPSTNLQSEGNYMFRSSLTISSTTTKVLTGIKFGLNRSNAPIGFISNCYTDILTNTGTAAIFTNKIYQLSSFFRASGGGSFTFDYVITFTGTGTLNIVSSIDFIRIS